MKLIERCIAKTRDESERLTEFRDFAPAVAAALAYYSRHRPRVVVADLAGSVASDLELPEGWEEGFSRLTSVEAPLGNLLDSADWTLYATPSGNVLRLVAAPGEGSVVRVSYTVTHTEETLPAHHQDAVASFAAAQCLETLSTLFASAVDPTISADSANRTSKSGDYAARARRMRQLGNETLGIKEGDTAPASSIVASVPARPGFRPRLTHRGW